MGDFFVGAFISSMCGYIIAFTLGFITSIIVPEFNLSLINATAIGTAIAFFIVGGIIYKI